MLKEDHVLTPTVYQDRQKRKVRCALPENPYNWNGSTVAAILERMEYCGHTVNFKTHRQSYKIKKIIENKHLIRGNHDTGYEDAGRLYRWFETVTDFNEIDDGETHILLCHYPMLYHKRGYMIHGHLHHGRGRDYELLRQLPRVLNAGVDVNRYRPVTLAELVENNRAFYAGERDDEVPSPPPMERGLPGSLPGKPDFRPIPRRKEDV